MMRTDKRIPLPTWMIWLAAVATLYTFGSTIWFDRHAPLNLVVLVATGISAAMFLLMLVQRLMGKRGTVGGRLGALLSLRVRLAVPAREHAATKTHGTPS